MALGKKTGGRVKGSRNKAKEAKDEAASAAAKAIASLLGGAYEGDAHTLMISIYQNPAMPWPLRFDAAKAALPFEKPKLTSTEVTGAAGGPIETFARIVIVPAKLPLPPPVVRRLERRDA